MARARADSSRTHPHHPLTPHPPYSFHNRQLNRLRQRPAPRDGTSRPSGVPIARRHDARKILAPSQPGTESSVRRASRGRLARRGRRARPRGAAEAPAPRPMPLPRVAPRVLVGRGSERDRSRGPHAPRYSVGKSAGQPELDVTTRLEQRPCAFPFPARANSSATRVLADSAGPGDGGRRRAPS